MTGADALQRRIGEALTERLTTVKQDPHDRRAIVVRRTSEGDRVLTQLTEGVADFERELRNEVGAERYDAFREVLDELVSDHLPPALTRGTYRLGDG